jgi:hypothetical protein
VGAPDAGPDRATAAPLGAPRRPYVDHLVDAISTAAIGIGLGLSPFMLLSIATLLIGRAAHNLRLLAEDEPAAPRR